MFAPLRGLAPHSCRFSLHAKPARGIVFPGLPTFQTLPSTPLSWSLFPAPPHTLPHTHPPCSRYLAAVPSDPWDAGSGHSSNAYDHGRESQQHQQEAAVGAGAGMSAPEGVPASTPPPRTPLQEQAFQNKYHHQHTQVTQFFFISSASAECTL